MAARGLVRLLLLAVVAALLSAPTALAGGLRVHVSGTGGGYVAQWPSSSEQCRADGGNCIFNDGGGGLILQAVPDPGSVFDGWPTPDCYLYQGNYCQKSGSSGPSCCTDLSVSFTKLRFTLAVSSTGPGKGAVVSAPDGINCSDACIATYDWGTTVTLTPQPAVGSKFAGWTRGCSGTDPCTVTLKDATGVTALFELDSFPLAVAKTGTGAGTVTSGQPGIACGAQCSAPFQFGSQVTLAATAATGSFFVGWNGPCSGTGGCILPIGTAAQQVGARFDPVAVTTRLRGRVLFLALYLGRASTLTVTVRGPASFSASASVGPGRAAPRFTLPARLRASRYQVRYSLRDALGSAALPPATLTLR
jgi:hypothetical protein